MSSRLPGQPPRRALSATFAALAAALAVVACGGSTSQLEPFVAERVFAVGDEASVLTSDGRNYGVNGLSTDGTAIDCAVRPIWVQVIASYYGLALAQCNRSTPTVEPRAFTLATVGARVADAESQVNAQVAAGGFREKDLTLFFIGVNDVLELYAQYPAQTEAALVAEAGRRGERAAAQVNRLVDLGSKVIVVNLPDMGLSPFARAEAAANAGTGFDRAALITRLTRAFNERLGVRIRIDGRFVGLAQFDLRTQQAAIAPAAFGFTDVSSASCTVAPPDCTTATIATGIDANGALWADGTRLGLRGQGSMAELVLQRAQLNPF
ncbi:MAG: SGNH/GDSL hydrolase family protein [Betaproteobacteria bacterium]|jgi:outer membrane lipase/esterase